jgi:hypothetical protein
MSIDEELEQESLEEGSEGENSVLSEENSSETLIKKHHKNDLSLSRETWDILLLLLNHFKIPMGFVENLLEESYYPDKLRDHTSIHPEDEKLYNIRIVVKEFFDMLKNNLPSIPTGERLQITTRGNNNNNWTTFINFIGKILIESDSTGPGYEFNKLLRQTMSDIASKKSAV